MSLSGQNSQCPKQKQKIRKRKADKIYARSLKFFSITFQTKKKFQIRQHIVHELLCRQMSMVSFSDLFHDLDSKQVRERDYQHSFSPTLRHTHTPADIQSNRLFTGSRCTHFYPIYKVSINF
ncbi:hypothetical protein EGW08_019588 [Elysia chlorotica]|uniref:Uncharacterized protein n=1 Tax=Elysia chlorotica TaxID=188477 RepID=A0A3S1H5J7_ELYCH|nr:hypothetical protein EGW08_019588 [Elysia chlorotica]